MAILTAILILAASADAGERPSRALVPVRPYRQACTLSSRWGTGAPLAGRDNNFVSFEGGKTAWNGHPIDEATLADYVERATAIVPRPTLTLHGGRVACAKLRRTAKTIELLADCKPVICVVSFAQPPAPTSAPPPPPRPAPPPLPPKPAKNAEPLNPASWVTNNDYPPAALRAGESGTATFSIGVDDKGMPAECEIVRTSGSALLDETTCAVLMARARFTPALDAQGRPMASHYTNRFRWEIPRQEIRFESWARVFQFELSASGEVSNCTLEILGWPVRDNQCFDIPKVPDDVRATLLGDAKSLVVEVRRWMEIDHSPPFAMADRVGAKQVFRRRAHFTVDKAGDIAKCDVLELVGEDLLKIAPYDCHPYLKYPEANAADPALRGASLEVSVTTRPPGPPSPPVWAGKRLEPLSAGTWMTDDDYPAEAMRAHQEGTVVFRLAVGTQGQVTGCTILTSSGWPLLDLASCSLLMKRARFNPAHNGKGEPVVATYQNQFRWEIPGESARLANQATAFRFHLSATGEISDCFAEQTDEPNRSNVCGAIWDMPDADRAALLGPARRAIAVEMREWLQIDGSPSPVAADLPSARTVFRRRTHFTVNDAGKVSRCDILEKSGADVMKQAEFDCHPGLEFPGAGEVDAAHRGATMVLSLTTRPLPTAR